MPLTGRTPDWRWLVLAGFGAAVILRHPGFFTHPRFWAEEGAFYFANAAAVAHTSQWYRGLTYTLHGYLALWPNLATTIAANLVRLETAPMVTTLMAFVVQLLPPTLVLWGRSDLWPSAGRKLVAVAIILLAPLSAEPWLNTINSQFYLALATVLILVEDEPTRRSHLWLHRGVLGLAGLTGPVSCVLTPLFGVRTLVERSRERRVQLAILSAACVVQVALLLTRPESTLSERSADFSAIDAAAVVWNQSVGLTLFGLDRANDSLRALRAARFLAQLGAPLFLDVFRLGLLSAVVALWLLIARGLSPIHRVTLLGSYALLVVLPLLGTLEDRPSLVVPGWAHRYFFVPNTILLLGLLASLEWRRWKGASWLLGLLLAHALYLGLHAYRTIVFAEPSWPDWREEVAAWRRDRSYRPRVWPAGPIWVVPLPRDLADPPERTPGG